MGIPAVFAQDGEKPPRAAGSKQYEITIQLYQALTGLSGGGLTSQTLPGVTGSFQIVNEVLDGVTLAMDGSTLTWDGKDAPDNPRIMRIGSPRIVTRENTAALLEVKNEELNQYFERKENNLFELKTLESDESTGFSIAVTPRVASDSPDQLDCDFSFRYTWIRDREPVDGVRLAVGKPILGSAKTEGKLGCRLGQWTCYRTILDGEGILYVFVKVKETAPD
jgi:hypothetical protein